MNKYLSYLHFIWLSQRNLSKIFEINKNYQDFFENLSYNNLLNFWIKEDKITEILNKKNKFNFNLIDDLILKFSVKLISYHDSNYPIQLKNLTYPPFLIYIRWNLDNNINLFSIVWSRKNTKYSEDVLKWIIPWLIKSWFWIVSWWAYWVDSIAHKITLENKWYTISVIWTWINLYYPESNKILYENIISSSWAILSIFPFYTQWEAYNFPIRNEIIAWLSNGILITEAWEKSGTLITAKLALELNKDVFVIPWDINKENSIWTNKLIQNWLGKLVLSVEDILEEYNVNYKNINKLENLKIKFEDEIEEKIYFLLSSNPKNASTISSELNIDIEEISSKLSIMEIKGYTKLWLWWVYSIHNYN